MDISRHLEYTLLRPDAGQKEIEELCHTGLAFSVFGVCVPPYWVKAACRIRGSSAMKVVTVCGFPLGYSKSAVKAAEALEALDDGADEIDMVMNVSALRSGMPGWIKPEIARLAELCHSREAILKVILETCYLSREEISQMSVLCRDAGADFIKTSTGFGKAGATAEDIRLIRAAVGSACGIKASGGIRSLDFARELLEAGADRIGASGHPSVFQG